MGLLDRLGVTRKRIDYLADGISTPFVSDGDYQLGQVTVAGLFSDVALPDLPLSRDAAIRIPAVSKARNLLVSSIAKFPLVALRDKEVLANQPAWLYRTNGNVSPYERMAWTVDDLIFYGVSLWLTERGVPDKDGRREIINAEWCPPQFWTITNGKILVDEHEVDDEDVLLFNSPFEGLLNIGSITLRGAQHTENAWVGRMRNPTPIIELKVTDDFEQGQEEVDEYVAAWAGKRQDVNGTIGFTPPGIEIRTHGEVRADLFVEGRNAIRTDIGSFLNVRASMLDGTIGTDSLTYTTKDGERNLFYELDLPFWTDPIEATLSQDKCVPRKQRVRFDKYDAFNQPIDTGVPTED